MFDKVELDENNTKLSFTPPPSESVVGKSDSTFPSAADLSAFKKTPQDPEFGIIQVDYIQLGPGASYSPYLDEQDLLININNQIEIAKQNDDIMSLRSILQTYQPLHQSVQARKEKIDKCISALNDAKIAKAKLKKTPAADLTNENLDQWQNWNNIESTCNSLLKAHVANQAAREKINNERKQAEEYRKADEYQFLSSNTRKRPRSTQQEGFQEQGENGEQDFLEGDLLPITESRKKNPNEGKIISDAEWQKMISSAWTNKGFSGNDKKNQGLVLIPPNTIVCKICEKSNIQYKRLAQHISGQKHRSRLSAFRKGEMNEHQDSQSNTGDISITDDIEGNLAETTSSDEERSCKAEVLRLHQFLVEWRTGAIAKNGDCFKRLSNVISNDFRVVSTNGQIVNRTELLQEVIKSYNAFDEGTFKLDIRNFRLCRGGKTCLGTYEEWQRIGQTTTVRVSTVVLRRLKDSRLEWVHLHETWLPGRGPNS